MQKESCKAHTMMVMAKKGLQNVCHIPKNSAQMWRELQVKFTVILTMALMLTTFSRESEALSWREQSLLSGPNY